MADEPVDLDSHRGMSAQKATEHRRRRLHEFQKDKTALEKRQADLEQLLSMEPALTWSEAAAKAQYLIQLLALTTEAIDPQRKRLIQQTLEDLTRLSQNDDKSPH